MLKSKLKGIPDAEIDKLLDIVDKNPEFFQKIAGEIEAKTKSGMDQQSAMMAVMQEHKDELQGIMKK